MRRLRKDQLFPVKQQRRPVGRRYRLLFRVVLVVFVRHVIGCASGRKRRRSVGLRRFGLVVIDSDAQSGRRVLVLEQSVASDGHSDRFRVVHGLGLGESNDEGTGTGTRFCWPADFWPAADNCRLEEMIKFDWDGAVMTSTSAGLSITQLGLE